MQDTWKPPKRGECKRFNSRGEHTSINSVRVVVVHFMGRILSSCDELCFIDMLVIKKFIASVNRSESYLLGLGTRIWSNPSNMEWESLMIVVKSLRILFTIAREIGFVLGDSKQRIEIPFKRGFLLLSSLLRPPRQCSIGVLHGPVPVWLIYLH